VESDLTKKGEHKKRSIATPPKRRRPIERKGYCTDHILAGHQKTWGRARGRGAVDWEEGKAERSLVGKKRSNDRSGTGYFGRSCGFVPPKTRRFV